MNQPFASSDNTGGVQHELNALSQILTPELTPRAQQVGVLFMIGMNWMTTSLEVFTRRDFGERYLSVARVVISFIAMQIYAGIINLPQILLIQPEYVQVGIGFMISYIVLAVFHRLTIWNRKKQGVLYHSMSFGVSNLAAPISRICLLLELPNSLSNDWILYRFIEPVICFLVASLVSRFDPITGAWLSLASVALFFKNNMIYEYQRSRILDLIDSQIESEYFNESLTSPQKDKRETAGFTVVSDFAELAKTDTSTIDIARTVAETMRSSTNGNSHTTT